MVTFAFVEQAFAGGQTPAQALPDAEAIRQTAREVLARPEYALDAPAPPGESLSDLFMRFMISVVRAVLRFFHALSAISPILAWLVIIALTVSLVLLIGHITLTIINSFKRRADQRRLPELAGRAKADPAVLARQAAEAASCGDYILGVRLLFRACLARLEKPDGTPDRPGATNREHLNRFRATPYYGALSLLVRVIDRKWYGYEPCMQSDFGACRDAYENLCQLVNRDADAQHA